MITFRDTMDPHSVDVIRDDQTHIAYLQWHPGRMPRIIPVSTATDHFTIQEMRVMTRELSNRIAIWVDKATAAALEPVTRAFEEKS